MASYRVQPYKDEAGEFRYRVIAENGNIVADSSEGYANKGDMLLMARSLFPTTEFDWALLPDPDGLIDDGDDVEDEEE